MRTKKKSRWAKENRNSQKSVKSVQLMGMGVYGGPRPKNGTFGVPGRPRPEHGRMRPRYGTSRVIRDGWQPYFGPFSTLQLGRSPVFVAGIIITDSLASFRWLRAPERIKFKLAVMFTMPARYCASVHLWYTTIRCWHAGKRSTPFVKFWSSRRPPVMHLITVGDCSFVTASPRFQNSLPSDVQSASSLTTFRRKLKAHLFQNFTCKILRRSSQGNPPSVALNARGWQNKAMSRWIIPSPGEFFVVLVLCSLIL